MRYESPAKSLAVQDGKEGMDRGLSLAAAGLPVRCGLDPLPEFDDIRS